MTAAIWLKLEGNEVGINGKRKVMKISIPTKSKLLSTNTQVIVLPIGTLICEVK